MRFTIPIRFTFEGTVEVEADRKSEAETIAIRDFGVVSGEPHTSNSEQVVDWKIPVHPDKEVIKPVRRGAPLATGRYESNEELVEEVLDMWYNTKMRQAQIARHARVSESTIANIIRDKRPRSQL